MKKWQIILIVVVVVGGLAGAVALGRGGHEGLATKAEFQSLQTEVRDDIGKVNANVVKLTGIVTNLVDEIPKIEPRIIKEVGRVAEVEDLKKQVVAGKKETERALEMADLKTKLAAAEKSLEEFKRGQQYVSPIPVVVTTPSLVIPPAGYYNGYRSGIVGVNQNGRYTINFQPSYAEFYLDGQRVSNGEQRYLYSGRWYSWSANSEVSFQTIWVGY